VDTDGKRVTAQLARCASVVALSSGAPATTDPPRRGFTPPERPRRRETGKDAPVTLGSTPTRPRNDPAQYDDLAASWWDPYGPLAMLQWIAKARASLMPDAERPDALLVDLGCGAGLLAPHLEGKGYRVAGFDLTFSALTHAGAHGIAAVQADVVALPLADGVADVVSAGEILEHVTDLGATLAEACRVLRPGGLLVLDTIARTRLARVIAIEVAERIPGGAPKGLHDPALFVDRKELIAICGRLGVPLSLSGLRPSFIQMLQWARRRRPAVEMRKTFSSAVLFQATGRKRR
jgi:2-polyprenyl-6-hydroxyphenyl methylase/3-demethylubiquinone-9 3-methyltransferase